MNLRNGLIMLVIILAVAVDQIQQIIQRRRSARRAVVNAKAANRGATPPAASPA